MCGNFFFNPIPSRSQWFFPSPIHTPRFNLVLFPFPSHSHRSFPFTPAPIPVLLVRVVSHQITNDRETQQCTEHWYCYKIKKSTKSSKIYMQCQRKQCLMDIQSETQQSTTNYCAKKGPLTVSDDQLSVDWRWESVEFSFPHSHSHSHSHETSSVNPIPMGIPWDPW